MNTVHRSEISVRSAGEGMDTKESRVGCDSQRHDARAQ